MELTKILIIEDDIIIQLFISRVLSSVGFDIVGEGTSCKEALELIANTKPDIILMDIGITGNKDGIETAELLNKSNSIPIIFMTGNSDQKTMERARATNPLDIIFKPIDEDQLKNKLLQLKEGS